MQLALSLASRLANFGARGVRFAQKGYQSFSFLLRFTLRIRKVNMSNKYVYVFGPSQTDGAADMKNLLGGKGANLAEMCRLGI